jgi:hypothetical protein
MLSFRTSGIPRERPDRLARGAAPIDVVGLGEKVVASQRR